MDRMNELDDLIRHVDEIIDRGGVVDSAPPHRAAPSTPPAEHYSAEAVAFHPPPEGRRFVSSELPSSMYYEIPVDQALPPGSSNHSTSTVASAGPAYDRICRWAKSKLARRKQREIEALNREMAECTFHPSRPTEEIPLSCMMPSSLYAENRAWGTEEYIQRQVEARERRREREEYVDSFWKSPAERWKNRTTEPQPFELGSSRKGTRRSVPRHEVFNELAPIARQHYEQDASEIEPPAVPYGLFSLRSSMAIVEQSPVRIAGARKDARQRFP